MIYDKFTDRARKVMRLANDQANRWNHEWVGTEHILAGLIREGSGVAAHVLADAGDNSILKAIEGVVQKGPELVTLGKLPMTPKAKAVCQRAGEVAEGINRHYIGTEHLLLAILEDAESAAVAAIIAAGSKVEDIKQRTLELIGQDCNSQIPAANWGASQWYDVYTGPHPQGHPVATALNRLADEVRLLRVSIDEANFIRKS